GTHSDPCVPGHGAKARGQAEARSVRNEPDVLGPRRQLADREALRTLSAELVAERLERRLVEARTRRAYVLPVDKLAVLDLLRPGGEVDLRIRRRVLRVRDRRGGVFDRRDEHRIRALVVE